MIILGIDPGNVTGVANWCIGQGGTPASEEVPADEMGEWLSDFLKAAPAGAVRVFAERYTMTPGIKTAQPAALEVMGVVKHECRQNWAPLEWVQPSTSKHMGADSVLRKIGWYRKTKDGHANDAMRLIIFGLARTDPDEYSRIMGI